VADRSRNGLTIPRGADAPRSPHGNVTKPTARLMVFKLVMAASKTWRRLRGQNQLPKVIDGVKFKDGIEDATDMKSAA
jgi:putative transposase